MANYYPSDSSPSLLPRGGISTTPTTSPTRTTRRLPPTITASTPNPPVALGKVHPLEVQSGTKLRLHIERIPPTSTQIAHISRAIDIANEILHGLFPTTFDPESYAEAFARCRSVSLVVACVRTFFEVESAYAEKISKEQEREERETRLRESIAGEREIGLRSVGEVTSEIAQLGNGAHVTVVRSTQKAKEERERCWG